MFTIKHRSLNRKETIVLKTYFSCVPNAILKLIVPDINLSSQSRKGEKGDHGKPNHQEGTVVKERIIAN